MGGGREGGGGSGSRALVAGEAPGALLPAETEEATKLSRSWTRGKAAELEGVEEIVLSKQKLSSVPGKVHNYKNLRRLDLSWNFLETLPAGLPKSVPLLRVLQLGYNRLEELPESLEDLRLLETLEVQSNRLQFLPQALEDCQRLKVLLAAKNNLRAFPHEVKGLRELETLDLGDNEITRVGRTLGTLKGLRFLSLAGNKVPELPIEVGRLKQLRRLDVSSNYLKRLPEELGRLDLLEILDASSNSLAAFPHSIYRCAALYNLDVSRNELMMLPAELCYCRKLKSVNVAGNSLIAFTGPVHQLEELTVLDLSDNKIVRLPSALGGLPLQELHVGGNPDLRLPPQVLEGGSAAMINYLQTVGEQHSLVDGYLDQFLQPGPAGPGSVSGTRASTPSRSDASANADGGPVLALTDGRSDDGEGGGRPGSPSTDADDPSATGPPDESPRQRRERLAKEARKRQSVLGIFKGGEGGKAEFKEHVARTREFLMSNPKFAAMLETKEERQKNFRDAVNHSRRVLQLKGMLSGASIVQQINRAKGTNVLDLRSSGLKSIPPDITSLTRLRVMDFRDNDVKKLVLGDFRELNVLNASYNKLQDLPDKLVAPQLRVLHLGFNGLGELSRGIGNLSNLEFLCLSGNRLEDLPDVFQNLDLKDLYLSENRLRQVPAPVLQIKALTKLSVACNQLRKLPEAIGHLPNLEFLDLSYNEISYLPKSLAELQALAQINMAFNPLGDEVPRELCELKGLRVLNFDYTGVKVIPDAMGNLRNLETLQASGNPFEYPFNLLYFRDPMLLVRFFCPDTTELNLSGCGLQTVPRSIALLKSLERLDLSDNNIVSLPVELGELKNLTELNLEGNPLEYPFRQLRCDDFGNARTVHFLNTDIQELNLSQAALVDIPPLLLRHTQHLQALNLASNRIKMLPDEFSELKMLTNLTLDNNGFKYFPEAVCSLVNLEVLHFSRNRFEALPASICDLTALQQLVVGSNELLELPSELVHMASLEILVCSNNSLKALPEGLGGLQRLRVLDCGCNDIAALPASVGMLKALEVLDMRINEVAGVPEEISECTSLVELDLSNNEIPALPEAMAGLKELAMLRLGANSLEQLPLRLCTGLSGLQELQLFGNPLPNVPSSMNVRGSEECARLLGLLENIFRRQEFLEGDSPETVPEEQSPNRPQGPAAGAKPRPSRPTRKKPPPAADGFTAA